MSAAATTLADLDDDAFGCIVDAGLSPTDLACLALTSRRLRDAARRAAPACIAVRATPPALAWAQARLASVARLTLDLPAHALPALSAILSSPTSPPLRLRDLTLTLSSAASVDGSGSGDDPHPPVPALALLPPAGRLTRLALHGAPLDTAGLDGTAAGAGLRALDLDTRHAGPLWRPHYSFHGLAALRLGAATPALAALAARLGPTGRRLGGGGDEGHPGGRRDNLPALAADLAASLPAARLTSLRLLVLMPQAVPFAIVLEGLVPSLPSLALLDVTNLAGGAPAASALLAAVAPGSYGGGGGGGGGGDGGGSSGAPGRHLALRLSTSRSPFDPLSTTALSPSTPAPWARLVALSLGSGRPMSAGGFGGAGTAPTYLDLAPLAAPGAGFPFHSRFNERYELRSRLPSPGNQNFLAAFHLLNQLRELGLRLVNVHGFHVETPAVDT
jgi:hypothetical protein